MGCEPRSAGPQDSRGFHSLAPGQTRVVEKALALSDHSVTEGAYEPWGRGEVRGLPRRGHIGVGP